MDTHEYTREKTLEQTHEATHEEDQEDQNDAKAQANMKTANEQAHGNALQTAQELLDTSGYTLRIEAASGVTLIKIITQ
jgi:DNA-binding protein H-NS